MGFDEPLRISRTLRDLRQAMPTYVPPLIGRVSYNNDRGVYTFQVGVSTILQAVNVYPNDLRNHPPRWFWDYTMTRFMQSLMDPALSEMVLQQHSAQIPCFLIDSATPSPHGAN